MSTQEIQQAVLNIGPSITEIICGHYVTYNGQPLGEDPYIVNETTGFDSIKDVVEYIEENQK